MSGNYILKASGLRVDGFMVMKGRPCTIVDISTAEGGGYKIVAIDLFTGKTYEECYQSTDDVEVPPVKRVDFQCTDISDGGYLGLMNDTDGEIREDIQLPPNEDLSDEIKAKFNNGANMLLTLTMSMGIEQITATKAME